MSPLFETRGRRRRRLRELPLTREQRAVVAGALHLHDRLPEPTASELEGLVQVFLDEKRFEGCGGLEVDDGMRLAIAAQACLLLAGRGPEAVYPDLVSVLVYPETYVAEEIVDHGDGLVSEELAERTGESWELGSLVLSWEDVLAADPDSGWNVVYHEFAHQLDAESGAMDGAPLLDDAVQVEAWARVMQEEYARFLRRVEQGRPTLLDDYAATEPAEFFAVATEHFFMTPRALARKETRLYEQLAGFYRLDPASWRRRPAPTA